MFDCFHLPPSSKADVQEFWGSQISGATSDWRVWMKPRGFDFLDVFLISGGAGGGGGAGAAAGSAKGGGGGGGSSGMSRYRYPLRWLPGALYVMVGAGGAGGAGGSSGSGQAGNDGQLSYLCIQPNTTVQNRLGISGNARPFLGGGGTAAAGGSGGAAGTIATIAECPLSFWAISMAFIAGVAGGAGGAHTGANGANVAIGTAGMIYSGTGGAGCTTTTFVGGQITGVASTPFATQLGGTAGNPGSNGFRHGAFPLIYGGTGGGSSNSATGGLGGSCGSDAPGAGGGGGGGGVTVGGRGGNGGPGLIAMICT